MKRLIGAAGVTAALAVGLAGPAAAQYDNPTTTVAPTTTSTAPTTSTTAPSTTTTVPRTTTTAPPPAQTSGTTSNPTPRPGEAVPIRTPQVGGGPAIDGTKPVAAVLVPASGDADVPMPTPTITTNADGSVTVSVTVPPSTPPGVYFVAVVGTTPSGASRAIIVPVVVRRVVAASVDAAPDAAGDAGPTLAAASLPPAVRAQVAQLQSQVDVAGGPEAIEEQVIEEGATIDVSDAQLLVNGSPVSELGEDESNRPLVAAAAVALGGFGLVLLRRRTPAISRRTT